MLTLFVAESIDFLLFPLQFLNELPILALQRLYLVVGLLLQPPVNLAVLPALVLKAIELLLELEHRELVLLLKALVLVTGHL